MERLTLAQLRRMGACEPALRWFEDRFPQGAPVTPESAERAAGLGASSIYGEWLGERLGTDGEAILRACPYYNIGGRCDCGRRHLLAAVDILKDKPEGWIPGDPTE